MSYRKIKFRGKDVFSGQWRYGAYIPTDFTQWREPSIFDGHHRAEVDGETLGQYTGRCDSEGKEIYEGDIIKRTLTPKICGQVIFGSSGWTVESGTNEYDITEFGSVRIVGNAFDNPELLEEGK